MCRCLDHLARRGLVESTGSRSVDRAVSSCMGDPMSSDDTSLVGKEFGNYRLAEVLGKGGTSIVYRGVHRSIGSEVAIKVLRRAGSPAVVKRVFPAGGGGGPTRPPRLPAGVG